MRNITKFKMMFSGAAVIAILAAVNIIAAWGAASGKSTHEQKIEKIMADYVMAIQAAENSYDKKTAPMIKSAKTIRDGAIAKVAQAIQNKLERAARDSKRLDRPDEAKLAEEEIVEFAKLTKVAQATDPYKPEADDAGGETIVEAGPLASHVSLKGHSYLAIMGEMTVAQAVARCKRMGGVWRPSKAPRNWCFSRNHCR